MHQSVDIERALQKTEVHCSVPNTSQVPRLTCSWKWVGSTYPLQAGNFSSHPSGRKFFRQSMAEEVLIGFLNISGSHMHNHTFFRPLVLPLALHFYPPAICHFFLLPIATFAAWDFTCICLVLISDFFSTIYLTSQLSIFWQKKCSNLMK